MWNKTCNIIKDMANCHESCFLLLPWVKSALTKNSHHKPIKPSKTKRSKNDWLATFDVMYYYLWHWILLLTSVEFHSEKYTACSKLQVAPALCLPKKMSSTSAHVRIRVSMGQGGGVESAIFARAFYYFPPPPPHCLQKNLFWSHISCLLTAFPYGKQKSRNQMPP